MRTQIIGVEVTLTPDELEVANNLGEKRYANAMRLGLHTAEWRDSTTRHPLGARAELAFCKWANLYPQLDAAYRPHFPDALLADALVDVKAIDNPTHNLVVRMDIPPGTFDLFVLVLEHEQGRYSILGWCLDSELEVRTLRADAGPCRFRAQADLRDPEDLYR